MTLDRGAAEELSQPVDSIAQLVDYLRQGEKPPERWRVGTEHEKLGVMAQSLEPVPYDGERGIEALLLRISSLDAWKPLTEAGRVMGLEKQGAGVSLEPGAQVELNGKPHRTLRATCRELHEHIRLLKQVGEPYGIVWLGLGVHPWHPVERMPRVPRQRYRIMRDYLPGRGDLALDMMHSTASVQVNFDYSDELDMVGKFRTALAVTPIVAALFANSSLAGGRPSGFVSQRLQIWNQTDPDRTGLLPFVFEDDFGYRRYVEWALDVPMFFLVRDSSYRPMKGKTFRRFLREGHEGERPTLADFDRHLTTLFPQARLKRILEVRCTDAVPPALLCAIPALWKGILYDADAREAAARLVQAWDAPAREAALEDVARAGLQAAPPSGAILPQARELVQISAEGLRRIGEREGGGQDDRSFLEPLDAELELGKSPGEVIVEHWENEWNRSSDLLIDYARY